MKNSFSIFVTQNSKFPFVRFSKLLSGYAYYKNYRINLISQEKEVTSISDFLKECESIKCDNNFKKPRVFHLFYELQHILYNTNISENCLLAIDLCYDHVDYLKDIKADHCKIKSINKVEFEGYKTKFKKGYQELLKGNCYQFNLTEKFDFHINTHNPYDIIGTLWKNKQARAPYGHASFLPSLNKLLISNSPESLFEITKKKQSLSITTRPIKGTISREESIEKSWRLLLDSEKDRAELYMITDLMRNDLSRIQKPNAKVIKKRSKLLVPGLIHQYSLIEAILDTTVDLYQVIKSLFPGGSVTGAPKKRVLDILRQLESRDRGFYCGSTILLYKNAIAASINIRSAEIDLESNIMSYSSGGGITLLSKSSLEYKEMYKKLESFTQLFV